MGYLQTLMRYKQGANTLLFSSVSEIPAEELTATRSIVFGSLLRTLNHSYSMDLVWQANLQNRPHGFTARSPDDCPDLEDLTTKQREIDDWYVSYAHSLSMSDENEIVEFSFICGGSGSMNRRDVLIHVVNHGTYHRGNVTGMMYDISVTPPTTDYPVFLKCGAPIRAPQPKALKLRR